MMVDLGETLYFAASDKNIKLTANLEIFQGISKLEKDTWLK